MVRNLSDAGRIRHGDAARPDALDGRCVCGAGISPLRDRLRAGPCIVGEAADLGVAKLYLWTTGAMREALYAGLGWSVLERPMYQGVERALMSIVRSRAPR